MTAQIPKRIIQTDASAELAPLPKASAVGLRLLHPSFEYLFFDDAQVNRFIDSEFPQYRLIFDTFPFRIQRYDFFRYLAVYHYGGFYFDTDILLSSSVDDLLKFGCVFPFEKLTIHDYLVDKYGMDWEVGNYAFGAAAGHPFLKAVIDNCILGHQNPEYVKDMTDTIPRVFRREMFVLAATGPGLVSRTLAEYRRSGDPVEILFPDDVRDEKSWFCFGTYGIHLQAGTWRRRKNLMHRVSERYWESWKQKARSRDSWKRGPKRSLEFESI